MIVKLTATAFAQTAVIAALLLGPAGTLRWPRASLYLGLMFVGTLAASISILRINPDLLAERLKPPIQESQPFADKVLLCAMLLAFIGLLVFIPIDVFKLRLWPKPYAALSFAGLVSFVLGFLLAYLGMRENAFAAPVVKHQSERHQVVVETGPYRFVRHPMYAGGLLVFAGTPLWLQSSAGTFAALVPAGLLALRIMAEEKFLKRELDGYAAYCRRTRYRLIPFLW